jgi:hypothetical protein
MSYVTHTNTHGRAKSRLIQHRLDHLPYTLQHYTYTMLTPWL